MNETKYFNIHNLAQANYFISNGIVPLMVGKSQSGIVFIKFIRDKTAEAVFTKCCKKTKFIANVFLFKPYINRYIYTF